MPDVRALCRWPEWQAFRKQLLASGKVSEEKLNEIELTTEVDSLGIVEIIVDLEESFGVEYKENGKVDLAGQRD